MIRPLTLVTLVAAAGAGLYLYQVKHSVSQLDRELREINRRTEQARERTQVLRAEWALLNEPERLRQVAQRHLPLEPMTPAQFVRLNEVERRLPAPRSFAGTPSLFAPVEPAGDGSATQIAIAAAEPRNRAAPPATTTPAATTPAPIAVASVAAAVVAAPAVAAAVRPAEPAPPAPAPAAVAAAEPPAAPRPAERRLAAAPAQRQASAPAAPVRPALHVERTASAPPAAQRVAAVRPPAAATVVQPTVVSALGGSGPSLAPPVPIARAAAATLPPSGIR